MKQEKYFTECGEKVYFDIARGQVHTGEFESVNCDNSDFTITVKLKAPPTTKNETARDRILSR